MKLAYMLARTRVLLGLLPVLGLASLTGCQTLGPRVADTTQLSRDAIVIGVPVLRQDELYECGLATVSALCQFYEREIRPEERQRLAAIADREQGLSGDELRETLEGLGLEVFIFRGQLDDTVAGLFHHLDSRRPVLVMISEDTQSHHYCLVTGYDRTTDSIVLLDPRRGQIVLPTAAFENVWGHSGYFSLLCVDPGDVT